MDSKGNLSRVSPAQHEALIKQIELMAREGKKKPSKIPLTEDQGRFLASKGEAFRGLWGRRLVKGMKAPVRAEFDRLLSEFLVEEAEELTAEQEASSDMIEMTVGEAASIIASSQE